jgi:hypothetical protein
MVPATPSAALSITMVANLVHSTASQTVAAGTAKHVFFAICLMTQGFVSGARPGRRAEKL